MFLVFLPRRFPVCFFPEYPVYVPSTGLGCLWINCSLCSLPFSFLRILEQPSVNEGLRNYPIHTQMKDIEDVEKNGLSKVTVWYLHFARVLTVGNIQTLLSEAVVPMESLVVSLNVNQISRLALSFHTALSSFRQVWKKKSFLQREYQCQADHYVKFSSLASSH